MSAQATSIGALISSILLSDHRILHLSWNKPFTHNLELHELREQVYLAYQPWAARFPDHVFDSAWRSLTQQPPETQAIQITALKALANEFLEFKHQEIFIRNNLLGAWQQGLVSRLSAIPIQATANVLFHFNNYPPANSSTSKTTSSKHRLTSWQSRILPTPRSYDAPVTDYIEREGLHETHLHLNGSTPAEICWLRAIRDPHTETRDFVTAWKKGRNSTHLRELIGQVNPELNPSIFYEHVRTASRLRSWLVGIAEDRITPNSSLPISCRFLATAGNEEWPVGLKNPAPSWRFTPDFNDELQWMAIIIRKLQSTPNTQLTRMFHTYLLLSNEHYKLLVQSETQYGFDQFQKLTLTELREPAEKDYEARFHAMHGSRKDLSTIGYLEGRFAPKNTPLKACRIFQDILGGYLNYLNEVNQLQALTAHRSLSSILNDLEQHFENPNHRHRSIHRLALVAHFIKQPWPPKQKHTAGPFRHYPLDQNLRKTTNILLSIIARWPKLKNWVRGIDAAANELHAPPDIFAPFFRVCYRAGITHRTFHAGEDFRHLLTGIASMWEALTFLDLKNGDRIGHGTAMGIDPSLWINRMPGMLTLPRGEWLTGVLSAWQLLKDIPEMQACAHRLQRELEQTACEIFGRSLAARDVESALSLRGLSRYDLMQCQANTSPPHSSLHDLWNEEAKCVQLAQKNMPDAIDLLWTWLSNTDVQIRADELITKPSTFMDTRSYLRLQQALMQEIADRGVLVETLPSSNVRISQYHHIGEHHSLRWLKAPGFIEDGDPEIMVCLGSDDPGIFASDLETEFRLLYTALRQTGLSDSETLHRLSVLNERGRTFRFHHSMLS